LIESLIECWYGGDCPYETLGVGASTCWYGVGCPYETLGVGASIYVVCGIASGVQGVIGGCL
jgi:hypothetical protein